MRNRYKVVCVFFPFAAVLRPYSGHVHSGLLSVAGGTGVGTLHPHILQVLIILPFNNVYSGAGNRQILMWVALHDRKMGGKIVRFSK